jgi:hypothetical protein
MRSICAIASFGVPMIQSRRSPRMAFYQWHARLLIGTNLQTHLLDFPEFTAIIHRLRRLQQAHHNLHRLRHHRVELVG